MDVFLTSGSIVLINSPDPALQCRYTGDLPSLSEPGTMTPCGTPGGGFAIEFRAFSRQRSLYILSGLLFLLIIDFSVSLVRADGVSGERK